MRLILQDLSCSLILRPFDLPKNGTATYKGFHTSLTSTAEFSYTVLLFALKHACSAPEKLHSASFIRLRLTDINSTVSGTKESSLSAAGLSDVEHPQASPNRTAFCMSFQLWGRSFSSAEQPGSAWQFILQPQAPASGCQFSKELTIS